MPSGEHWSSYSLFGYFICVLTLALRKEEIYSLFFKDQTRYLLLEVTSRITLKGYIVKSSLRISNLLFICLGHQEIVILTAYNCTPPSGQSHRFPSHLCSLCVNMLRKSCFLSDANSEDFLLLTDLIPRRVYQTESMSGLLSGELSCVYTVIFSKESNHYSPCKLNVARFLPFFAWSILNVNCKQSHVYCRLALSLSSTSSKSYRGSGFIHFNIELNFASQWQRQQTVVLKQIGSGEKTRSMGESIMTGTPGKEPTVFLLGFVLLAVENGLYLFLQRKETPAIPVRGDKHWDSPV